MSNTINVNGVDLYYELNGNSGEPLVLVHGSWVDHHVWDAVVPVLAQSFRVLSYDRRGHSLSERPSAPDTIHDDIADLASLIQSLGLAPATIIGNSFGGSIALRLASEHPDLVNGLIVNEPPLISLLAGNPQGQQALGMIQERFVAVEERLAAGNMEGAAQYFVEQIVFGEGAWAHISPELKKTVTFNGPTFLNELRDPDAYVVNPAQLQGYSGPVLLTYGEESPPFLVAIVKMLANMLPNAELKMYEGTDHEPHRSQPEKFVATIKQFVGETTTNPT